MLLLVLFICALAIIGAKTNSRKGIAIPDI